MLLGREDESRSRCGRAVIVGEVDDKEDCELRSVSAAVEKVMRSTEIGNRTMEVR